AFVLASTRRHTRSKRDWSSDVCSSDLFIAARGVDGRDVAHHPLLIFRNTVDIGPVGIADRLVGAGRLFLGGRDEPLAGIGAHAEIGRASCRERAWTGRDALAIHES